LKIRIDNAQRPVESVLEVTDQAGDRVATMAGFQIHPHPCVGYVHSKSLTDMQVHCFDLGESIARLWRSP